MPKAEHKPSISSYALMLAACCLVTGTLARPASAGEILKLPALAKPMSAAEMYELYRDKTWRWGQGGGRFFSEDRRFIAVVEEDGSQKIGVGRYRLFNNGQMCIDAVWTSSKDAAKASTCFWHYKDRGTIYQAKVGGEGGWYVFRHYKPAQTDEYSNLTDEDSLSAKFASLQKELAAFSGGLNGG